MNDNLFSGIIKNSAFLLPIFLFPKSFTYSFLFEQPPPGSALLSTGCKWDVRADGNTEDLSWESQGQGAISGLSCLNGSEPTFTCFSFLNVCYFEMPQILADSKLFWTWARHFPSPCCNHGWILQAFPITDLSYQQQEFYCISLREDFVARWELLVVYIRLWVMPFC